MQPNFKNSVCFSHQARNCRTKMAALTKQVSLQLSVSLPKESKPHKNSKGHQKSCSLIIGGGKAQGCRGSTACSRSCIMPLSLVLLCQKKLPSNSRSTVPPPGWAYTAACTVMTINSWVLKQGVLSQRSLFSSPGSSSDELFKVVFKRVKNHFILKWDLVMYLLKAIFFKNSYFFVVVKKTIHEIKSREYYLPKAVSDFSRS